MVPSEDREGLSCLCPNPEPSTLNHELGGSIVVNVPGRLKFDKNGLIPAIAQDVETGLVLMIAYMNREALRKTLRSGFAHYFSRSRRRLWKKGEESGHLQRVREVRLDCDGDAVLLKVRQEKAACHLGYRSCFFRRLRKDLAPSAPVTGRVFRPETVYAPSPEILMEVYRTILERKARRPPGSYVASLFEQGTSQILKKVGEEAAEVLVSGAGRRRRDIIHEVVDLWFHTLVLLAACGVPLERVWKEFQGRVGKRKPPAVESRVKGRKRR
jgi:phosphoribosyl-AMP cyclohydrolase / phosphoribosyl-ATP pyrophosphohydrolase